MAEARKFLDPDWPKRDVRTQLLDILNRAERAVDNMQQEREQFHPKGERTTSSSEIAEAQQNAEKVGIDELSPTETESITDWFGRVGEVIDANGDRKVLWAGLRGYASRFRGDEKATRLNKKLIRRFLRHALR